MCERRRWKRDLIWFWGREGEGLPCADEDETKASYGESEEPHFFSFFFWFLCFSFGSETLLEASGDDFGVLILGFDDILRWVAGLFPLLRMSSFFDCQINFRRLC